MHRKLFLLGLTSLGGIFGLNFAFKGDESVPELIKYEESEAEFEEPLPQPTAEEIKKIKEEEARQKEQRDYEEWKKRDDARVAREDATVLRGIKTSDLRRWIIVFFKDNSYSTTRLSRTSLDGMFSSLSRRGYPTFFKNNQVNWEVIKQEVEKHNATLRVNQ